ncbi:uncharacterized protein LOC120172070 [Hibiscus syriacus]|uniref:uncharacterized protein LOC120172070 n=1 Tax=Hibiscus syriacus TaxID=106335 RepID=UPI001920597D|nr:uncharacterized protein LOC120172070 [Hibiscus syriacus]
MAEGIYGNQLNSLRCTMGNLPWLIGGDFNVILNPEENSVSVSSPTLADISDFWNCVENLGIFYHPYIGPLFTWSNKQHDAYLARKLDRVLINPIWIDAFPDSVVEFQASGDSDHCPAFQPIDGNPTHILFQKLKRLKCSLKAFNRVNFNDISNKVTQKRDELLSIQLANLNLGSVGININSELQAERELKYLEEAELLFYK